MGMGAASSNGSFRWQTAHLDVALAWHEQLSPKMAPISQRKHLGRDKFSTQFSLLKTQQYVDPAARTVTPTIHRTISWNASGGLIATGANDKTVRVWNPERTSPRSQIDIRGHGLWKRCSSTRCESSSWRAVPP